MERTRIVEYSTPSGDSPFAEWFDRLDANAGGGPQEQENTMALTRDFKRTILARAQRDERFRFSLLTEALNAFLGGDVVTGKAMLRDLINATAGFERLAAETGTPAKSLHRMLSPEGNPRTDNFFRILSALQKSAGVRLRVIAKAG